MPTPALRRGFSPRSLFLARTTIARCFTARAADKEPPTAPVTDAVLAKLSAEKLHPLTLADLISYGHPPLSQSSLYRAANFALSVLPARLAHRIQAIRNLPYIVVTNPNVSEIHDNYIHSLSTLLPFEGRNIETQEDEEAFTEAMLGLVQRHTNTIPIIARGFLESRKYISSAAVTRFLDAHLSARIGTRLVAEQHIALHYSSQQSSSPAPDDNPPSPSSYIGIIDTALRPSTILQNCESFVAEICELRYGVRPSLRIDGDPSARISHVPVHLEYILTELLKNAFRAVVERGTERHPVLVTIAPTNPLQQTGDHVAEGLTIRIRDRGGGISPANLKNLWNYGFTTFSEHDAAAATTAPGGSGMDALNVISGGGGGGGGSSLAGLGYGLPLGRAYAEFFGGSIAVQSLWGWGTDVYLGLRGVKREEGKGMEG